MDICEAVTPPGLEGQRETVESERTKSKSKEDDYGRRSGSDHMDAGSGDDEDAGPPRKKRYHRHTLRQIQEMEMVFKKCPNPDDKQRQELSKELALEPRQVKFWFQNRRTQLKTQQKRAENYKLRVANEILMAENVTIREAIKNASCPHYGGPAVLGEMSRDEHQLRIENARIKDELDRVSTLAAKCLGRPIMSLAPHQSQLPSSSLDLAGGGSFGMHPGSIQSLMSDLVPRTTSISDSEKLLVMEPALTAMEELIWMCRPDGPSWMPSLQGPNEVLNYEEDIQQHPRSLDKI